MTGSKERAAFVASSQHRAKFLDELRIADDPDRLWPVPDFIRALNLKPIFTRRLLEHFEALGQPTLSLYELMTLIQPAVVWLRVKGMGRYGLRDLRKELEHLPLPAGCARLRNSIFGKAPA